MSAQSTIQLLENKHVVPKEFNKVAAKYDFATSMSQGYQDDLNRSADLLQLTGNEIVLDVCCGTGKSTIAFKDKITTGKIICIDNSEGMLQVAAQKFAKEIEHRKLELSLQDAMQLSLPDHSADAIFMAYGLRNMPDYVRCIQNLHRILKPGGQLVIHDYSLKEIWYAKPLWAVLGYGFIVPFCTVLSGSSIIYTYLIKSVLQFLSPSQIQSLLTNNGFQSVEIHTHASWRNPILHSFRAIKK